MIAWGIDTGTSRNASGVARVELIGQTWRATVWKLQGTQGAPLSIEHTVGPQVRALWETHGEGDMAADGFYAPELRAGLGTSIHVRLQGGELRDVYGPTRRLVHRDTHQRLIVARRGYVWTGSNWVADERSGERVIAGLKAVEAVHREGKLVVSLPEDGASHHDEAVAVMRALWLARAGEPDRFTMATVAGRSAYTDQLKQAGWYPVARY